MARNGNGQSATLFGWSIGQIAPWLITATVTSLLAWQSLATRSDLLLGEASDRLARLERSTVENKDALVLAVRERNDLVTMLRISDATQTTRTDDLKIEVDRLRAQTHAEELRRIEDVVADLARLRQQLDEHRDIDRSSIQKSQQK